MTGKTCKWFSASAEFIEQGAALDESYDFNVPFESNMCHCPELDRDIDPVPCEYNTQMEHCKVFRPRKNQHLLSLAFIERNSIPAGQLQLWRSDLGYGFPGYVIVLVTSPEIKQSDPVNHYDDDAYGFSDKDYPDALDQATKLYQQFYNCFSSDGFTAKSIPEEEIANLLEKHIHNHSDEPTSTYLDKLVAL